MKDCKKCSNSEHWEEKYGHVFRYCHLKCKDIEYDQCKVEANNCDDYEE